jgi:chromosome segregation ATPase
VKSVPDAAGARITIRPRHQAPVISLPIAIVCIGVPLGALLLDTSAAVPDPDVAGRAPGLLLVGVEPAGPEQGAQEDRQASPHPFNRVLDGTRAMLEDVVEAEAADTELRNELGALKRDNECLALELAQASTRRIEPERSSELAEARIAKLTKVVDVVLRDAAHMDEELAWLRWQNGQLNQSLARADATCKAALAEAEKARAEMAKELDAARDAVAQSKADVAGLYSELKAKHQELAAANSAREETGARVSQVEKTVVESSAADAERLKAKLAGVKEQLGQAAEAAREAEWASVAASNEAERLRSEAARARDEAIAAAAEIARLQTANAKLEKEIRSLRCAAESACQNLPRS